MLVEVLKNVKSTIVKATIKFNISCDKKNPTKCNKILSKSLKKLNRIFDTKKYKLIQTNLLFSKTANLDKLVLKPDKLFKLFESLFFSANTKFFSFNETLLQNLNNTS